MRAVEKLSIANYELSSLLSSQNDLEIILIKFVSKNIFVQQYARISNQLSNHSQSKSQTCTFASTAFASSHRWRSQTYHRSFNSWSPEVANAHVLAVGASVNHVRIAFMFQCCQNRVTEFKRAMMNE